MSDEVKLYLQVLVFTFVSVHIILGFAIYVGFLISLLERI